MRWLRNSTLTMACIGLLLVVTFWHTPGTKARAVARRPHFTDIASRSEFPYVTNNNFTGRKYFPQTHVRRSRRS